MFLYWGAVWCPPCNQVKSTIFNRPDFIAATRQFVPVYLDGDSENAQQLGEKFKVRGYPTMILFRPDAPRSPACRARWIRNVTCARCSWD